MMTTSHAPLSGKDILLNAIPLVLIAVIALFFVYSCRRSRQITRDATEAVRQFQTVRAGYNTRLTQFLEAKITLSQYRTLLKETDEPAIRTLADRLDALHPDARKAIPAFDHIRDLLHTEMDLNTVILNEQHTDLPVAHLLPFLDKMNALQTKIHQTAADSPVATP